MSAPSPTDLTLVTGVSGFLGSAVARRLLAAGAPVRALVRPASPRVNLEGLDLEVVVGDLADPASLTVALKGVRHLFHVAADYRLWARDPEDIVRNNLNGARNIMTAAVKAGVERVVYTSSVATLAIGESGKPADETTPLDAGSAVGAYKRSKVLAERAVEALVAQEGLNAVIVNPSTPIGPRDVKPTPTGRIIVEAANGRMPAYVDTGLNLVHVDDVADGHLQAWAKGVAGERYILGGEDVSLKALLSDIAKLRGRKASAVRLPRAPLTPLAYVTEALAHVTGREPLLTRDSLRMAAKTMYFSSQKAKDRLGYAPRSYHQGLADALAWFEARGYVPNR